MARSRLLSRTGCLSCRLRKTKCDEARPACKTCIRLGRGCLYPEQDPEQFVKEAEAHRLRIQTARTKVPVSVQEEPVSSQVPGKVALTGFSDQICIGFTLHSLFKGFNHPVKTNYDTNALTVQTELSFTERGSSKSWLCLSALGVTFYALAHKDREVLRRGRSLHSDAIKVMQAAMQDPVERSSADSVAAMVFLTNFSLLCPLPSANWAQYSKALTDLIRSMGPDAFSTIPRRFILENNRLALIQSASFRRQPCFLNEPAWKSTPWRIDTVAKDDYQRLLDVYAEIPGFEAAVDAFVGTEEPVQRAQQRARLTRRLFDIQNKLHAWRLSVEPIDIRAMSPDRLRDFATLDFEMFNAAEFGNTQIALSVLIFNLVLLVLHEYNSALGLCVFSRPDDGAEGHKAGARSSNMAGAAALSLRSCGAPPADSRRPLVLRRDVLLDTRTLDRAVAASDEICSCVLWIFDKSGQGVGTLYLIGALQVAIQAIGSQEPERASWMGRVLGAIRSTWSGHATWTMQQC